MTQQEKDYCEICGIHDGCAYVSRGLQSKCEKMQIFADGFDAAVNKTIIWLCKLSPEQLKDVSLDGFEKAMYKWQKDMAQWVNKHQIFQITDFRNFSPRKGFRCAQYFD